MLERALEALENLAHRGAVSADGLTGDGAGVLTQIPHRFFRRELADRGVGLDRDVDLAVGVFFLPADDGEARRAAVALAEQAFARGELRLLAWREVPLGENVLGEKAERTRPVVRQALVARPPGLDDGGYERLLYLTRRRIERGTERMGLAAVYLPSFSHRTLVYKGLMLASQLARFYPDLADPDYATALALFHQRYSTNTFPTWRLAQPFRLLGHNGEINTLAGNRNWMRARERELTGTVFGDLMEELIPVIQEGGSDSATLDNALELLVMFGRDPIPIAAGQKGEFVTAVDSKGQQWGLVAFHIVSKEVPDWIWATFEHASNPCYSKYLQAQDRFGLTADGKVSPQLIALFEMYGLDVGVYSNYRLDGAQVNFTDPAGRPIILGNSVTEFSFQTTASCMTCHARATADQTGAGHLSVFNQHGQSDHGTPDPSWYFSSFDPLKRSYLPLDFLWSVAFCPNEIGSTTQNCSLPPVDE